MKMPHVSRFTVALALAALFSFPVHTPLLAETIKVVAPEEVNKKAAEAWEPIAARPFTGDFADMDEFLKKYPDAKISPEVFSARYSLVQGSANIKDYNDFIRKYPGRLSTSMAVQEVFSLYEHVGSMGGYIDFVRLYPGTGQGMLARQKIHLIAFDLAVQRDTLEDYESFICLFPDASQIGKIKEFALNRRKVDEMAFLALPGNQQNDAKQKRSNILAVQMGEAITKADKSASAGTRLLYYFKADLLMNVLTELYNDFPAALEVRNEARHQELKEKLEQLDATLKKNHQDLVEQLHKEFTETRKSIADGISALKLDNAETRKLLADGFDRLEAKSEQLHEDLLGLHGELEKLNAQMADMRQGIEATNRKLDGIRSDLQQQYTEYRNLAANIGKSIGTNNEILANISKGMDTQNGLLGQLARNAPNQAVTANQVGSVNMLLAQKQGQMDEQYAVNKGSYAPIKYSIEAAGKVFDTWIEKGTKAAINEAVGAVPGLLFESVGYAVDKIPVAGEFLSATAAELAYDLGMQGVKHVRSLNPQEIDFYASAADKIVNGSKIIVKGALQMCRQDTLDRKAEIDRQMAQYTPGILSQLIAENF